MTDAMNTMEIGSTSTSIELGSKFIQWGLGLFVLGFLAGFIPILHYIHGAVAGDIGHAFMKNMTLWWGCPAVLMEYALKTGGLGMAVIGLCYRVLPRADTSAPISGTESKAPMICVVGLVGAAIYAGVGYVVCNMIWPNFYFAHNETGKDVWLTGQLVGIAVYVYGIYFAFRAVTRDHASTAS
ncbi:hypothetical protein [Ruegeria atlantica]|uniref:Uncharacterized protein n=1 Tax=Ruegeria atlantica TaxID=81569 RepID=A0A0P1EBL6_9RHOB|nr:hypothetical protein [Ruegeria atlantica]CUH46219.1 hypothetical protein RUA4292_00384 [Ruegeria atlantica]